MLEKAKLGTRFVCYQCGTKFYDLNRPEPTCPSCEANQREAPVRDIKSLLSSRGTIRKAPAAAPAKKEEPKKKDEAFDNTDFDNAEDASSDDEEAEEDEA